MTFSTGSARSTELRIPVVRDRVVCPLIGPVDLDRCRECAYLLRMEADSDGRGVASIVCAFGAGGDPTSKK